MPSIASAGSGLTRAARRWLGGSQLGLVAMALVVGAGAGVGAAGFRELVFAVTWLVTGHDQFGQQGHAASAHLPFLGIWFVLVAPIAGALVYSPLIQRFAKEARGHGVPEVMVAVAENGGRIRPPVTIVKALASALCIGTGGSVGREGPIVQIGSAYASTLGQLVRMSESRLRVIVACGAAGGIAATFNAPVTGLFFGFEIVLREFSLEALFATSLAAVTADVVSRAFFGSAPFFAAVPHDLIVGSDWSYLLFALLGVVAALIGVGFKTVLYGLEDYVDALWRGRPEWARPVIGGVVLGALLLALPQMYGVGYPVMDKVLANHEVLGFLAILVVAKVAASSLTLAIGGSGGVFAPSLFMGAATGMAFGVLARHVFGTIVGPPAIYGVIAMGGVFAAAAQAPLTAIASVAEMTGNFTLTLPIMLVSGIAAAVARRFTYGSIYTTKLLRRGIDIERPRGTGLLQRLTAAQAMQPLEALDGRGWLPGRGGARGVNPDLGDGVAGLLGELGDAREPQELFEDESLAQALRQLVLYGHAGLPVLSHDGAHVRGWITQKDVLRTLGERLVAESRQIERGAIAAEVNTPEGSRRVHEPTRPLDGYRIVELSLNEDSPAVGRTLEEIALPSGVIPLAESSGGEWIAPRAGATLLANSRLVLLVPEAQTAGSASTACPRGDR